MRANQSTRTKKAAPKRPTYKKVEKAYEYPVRIIFKSDKTEAEYDHTLPLSTHRKEVVYMYKYIKAEITHPSGKSTKLGKTVPFRAQDLERMKKITTIEFVYDQG